jgi:DNA-3-methyladenine glycosylase II
VSSQRDGRAPTTGAFAHEYESLAELDPIFASLIDIHGHPNPFEWHDGGRTGSSLFAALVLHIVGQRVSATAAFRVFDRIAVAGGGIPSPDSLLALGLDGLRNAGLSSAKASYLEDLATRQRAGLLDVERMAARSDSDVITTLTAVRGIGLWTAQMFLMRQLHRPDVLPAGDTGIRRAVQLCWGLGTFPTIDDVARRATAWTPRRSFAAGLLWRSLWPPGVASDQKERALLRESGRAEATAD